MSFFSRMFGKKDKSASEAPPKKVFAKIIPTLHDDMAGREDGGAEAAHEVGALCGPGPVEAQRRQAERGTLLSHIGLSLIW